MLYYAASYFWFLLSIIVSDIIIVVNLAYWVIALFNPDVVSPFQFADDVYVYLMVAWGLMYYLFVLQINLALATDVGQSTIQNFILSCLSYFTYAQLFLLISLARALFFRRRQNDGEKSQVVQNAAIWIRELFEWGRASTKVPWDRVSAIGRPNPHFPLLICPVS